MRTSTLFRTAFVTLAIYWTTIVPAAEIEVYFSPRGGATQALCREIAAAKTSVDVAAFQLSYRPIADELMAAKGRNVRVRVVLDASQEAPAADEPRRLRSRSIELRTDRWEKLQHNKYAVIDGKTVVTGSHNWSENAERRNAENLLIIRDEQLASKFAADFGKHWEHAMAFVPKHASQKKRTTTHAALSFFLEPPTLKGFFQWHALLAPYIPTPPPARSPSH